VGTPAPFWKQKKGSQVSPTAPKMDTKKGKGIPMQDTLAYNCVDYREKGKTRPNQPRLFLTARPPRYREKGKTYPVSNRAIITLFCFLPRLSINNLRYASIIDSERPRCPVSAHL